MQAVVQEINTDYQTQIDTIKANISYDVLEMSGSRAVWPEVLAVYADGINSYGYEVYNWLAQNAYRYGFIYRYPENKVAITGIANEPWHYRYVGVNAATEIYKRRICLEEYLGETN